MPPMPGSFAIDQGHSSGLTTDQRGRARSNDDPSIINATLGDGSDIGAVEIGSASLAVTNTNDAGPGSLRQTILDASPIDADTVTLAPNVSNTITLTSGEIVLNKSLTVVGPAANRLTVSGNNSSRVFHVTGGSPYLQSLNITRGLAADYGGGILVDAGALFLSDCQVVSNATAFFASGGGIFVSGNALLSLLNCSVTHNQASISGGGIGLVQNANASIYSCTIASNRTTFIPDGIFAPYGGGISMNGGILTLLNSTIASNVSGYYGGGIISGYFVQGIADIRNSIIAGNTAVHSGPDVLGQFNSGGYNLIGNSSGGTGFTNTGDQLNADPLLGPLANYGGGTLAMALRVGSPALDKGKSFGATTDQRGSARIVDDPNVANASGGGGADIGAYEADPRYHVANVSRVGNDVRVGLMTMLGKSYRVEYSTEVDADFWLVFANDLPGNGQVLWVTNFGGANQPSRFYRSGPPLERAAIQTEARHESESRLER
jgi:hypothetical protein